MSNQPKYGMLLTPFTEPLIFSSQRGEFKPLPYGSVWVFNPNEVIWALKNHPSWGRFCLNPHKEGNYFSRTIVLLELVGSYLGRKKRQRRKARWKGNYVYYRAVAYAQKGNWGQFILLLGSPAEEKLKDCQPSIIPLVLPQSLAGFVRNDKPIIYEEKFL